MDDKPNEQPPKKKNDDGTLLSPLLFWGGLFGLFAISKWLESESPGTGKWLFLGTLIAGVVGTIFYILIGRTVKETATNVATVIKWIIGLIVVSFVVAPLTECGSPNVNPPSDVYFRK